jgi:hypothetical protein
MRRQRVLLGKMLTLTFLSLVFACQDDKPSVTGIEFRPELVVMPQVVFLQVGQATQLWAYFENGLGTALPHPPGYAVSWESSDPAVAQVTEDGKLLARAEGQTRITAGLRGHRATAKVWVIGPYESGK